MNFKSIYYFLCIFFILSCNEKKQKEIEETEFEITLEVTVDNLSEYPKVIDSLGLHDLYDSTKWQLYLLRVFDTPKYMNEYLHPDDQYDNIYILDSSVSYAKLELRFDSMYVDDSILSLFFEFYVNDTLALNPNNFGFMKPYTEGMQFKLNNNSDSVCVHYLYKYKYFNISSTATCWTKKDAKKHLNEIKKDRLVNPLQPDVIEFLNKHKHEIHPWLYKEAIKRGVIKE